ncbi:MAG: archease [Methanosarcinales archaeon]|nr:archease [Methanosarcinales archaeon]
MHPHNNSRNHNHLNHDRAHDRPNDHTHDSRSPPIEYLDHPADLKFRVYGETIEEAFEYAALAMFGAMIDTATVHQTETLKIDLVADDCEDLLYDFLSELLYLFEAEEIVFGWFDVKRIEERCGKYHLIACASGEEIDTDRHRFGIGVKAVTFHEMVIERTDRGYLIQAILDT